MKKLLLLGLVGWLGFAGIRHWQAERAPETQGPPPPLYDRPYVVVYGRDSCGNTQAMRRQLEREGVHFDYQSVDVQAVEDLLHQRMEQSGISTARYYLPVVDVSGTLSVA